MSKKTLLLVVVCGALTVAGASAAPPARGVGALVSDEVARYWAAPDDVEYDAQGNVAYAAFKDAKTHTEQIYDHGVWFTWLWARDRMQIERAIGPDTDERYEYDERGRTSGVTVRYGGLNLGVRTTAQGLIEVPGLPRLVLTHDERGRLEAVESEFGTLVEYEYRPSGQVKKVELPGSFVLTLDPVESGRIRETLRGSGKRVLRETVVPNQFENRPLRLLALDTVAKALGLGEQWWKQVKTVWNSTGTVVTVTDLKGATLLYLLRFGTINVGFDRTGRALFYDFDVWDQVTGPDAEVVALSMAPTRIIVTADGRVELQAPMVPNSGFESFWGDARDDGTPTWNYRIIEGRRSVQAIPTSLGTVGAMEMMVCDIVTYCVTWSDSTGASGSSCTTFFYYCDGGGGGGGGTCSTCDPRGGGGGGGGGTPDYLGNQIARLDLHYQVNRAIQAALPKLSNPACLAVFSKWVGIVNPLTNSAITPADVLAHEPGNPSAAYWFTNSIAFRDGSNDSQCGNSITEAFVRPPGSSLIYICGKTFLNLAMSNIGLAADYLIHEELHTLYLGEAPGYPGQPTTDEITTAVEAACGR